MTTIPVVEARQQFSALVDDAVKTHNRVYVTRNGKPAVVMLSSEDYESLLNEPLAPQYSARRGEYRVLYLIDDDKIVVVVTAVSHRADAYRSG